MTLGVGVLPANSVHAGEMTTEEGGMHPTGMCSI